MILVQIVLTKTRNVTSCTVMFEDVIKMSLLQKGQTNRTKNMVSVFYGIQCFWNNFELNMIIMSNYNPDHNTSASKTVRFVHTLFRKMFPTLAVHTIASTAKTKWQS